MAGLKVRNSSTKVREFGHLGFIRSLHFLLNFLDFMKAAVLVANGAPQKAFEIREMPNPRPDAGQVSVDVEAFGLNFADVMARLGLYRDCPPLPAIIGYEAVGRVSALGPGVEGFAKGQRVLAFTRFGAYATKVVTDVNGVVPIPDDMPASEAAALATQYVTAWFAAEYITRIYEGEHVLIHAAAGGVGTALVQLAKHKGCIIYGTAGSPQKLDYLRQQGVHYPINYRTSNFADEVKKVSPSGKLDVVFDPIGGKSVKLGFGLLRGGGRIVCYGAASMSGRRRNFIKDLKAGAGFGIYHPAQFMMNSKSMLGVNMLRIADERPEVLQRCLNAVVDFTKKGIFKPVTGGYFPIGQLAEAHEFLEFRKSIGKVAVHW